MFVPFELHPKTNMKLPFWKSALRSYPRDPRKTENFRWIVTRFCRGRWPERGSGTSVVQCQTWLMNASEKTSVSWTAPCRRHARRHKILSHHSSVQSFWSVLLAHRNTHTSPRLRPRTNSNFKLHFKFWTPTSDWHRKNNTISGSTCSCLRKHENGSKLEQSDSRGYEPSYIPRQWKLAKYIFLRNSIKRKCT